MSSFVLCVLAAVLAVVNAHKHTYYLPGVAPQTFKQGDAVKLFVNKLTSTKTQIPYDYYSLPYCRPKKFGLKSENLGEVLSGDRIENSVYKLDMKQTKTCEVACVKQLKKSDKEAFIQAIDDDYKVHWMVDNIPVGMFSTAPQTAEKSFSRGFPVGFTTSAPGTTSKKEGSSGSKLHHLNNHLRIILKYHDDIDGTVTPADGELTSKVVGFRVEPMSIKHTWPGGDAVSPTNGQLTTCSTASPAVNDPRNYLTLDAKNFDSHIVFTYDVMWEKSAIEWSERWDVYLNTSSTMDDVHWYSITNSIVIVLFLTVMIAVILLRALRKDIAQYNDPTNLEEAKEESGWKLVHGDVFRPPSAHPMLFSVFVGSGVQLCCMGIATLTFALLGLLSPANRGSLITAFILLFVFMGSFAGFYSSSIYKMFRGLMWKQNTLMTAFFYPGVVFGIIIALNLLLWVKGSSGAIPFSSLFTLLFLWFCVSVPLVFLGSFFGYKREIPNFPVRTNQIPRAIPQQQWYMHPFVTCLIGGILPFGAVSVELYFIMSALWLHHIYYIFGFLFLVALVLIVTCAEVSILLCYFQLVNEDYRWWWRSFLHAGSCAFYTGLYAVWYHMTELDFDGLIPVILYYGYMFIICFTFFLVTGTIGYFSCFWFNYQIYGSIKVD